MTRKLDTCDKDQDSKILKETNYLIFAWNDYDPVSGEGDWVYHGRNRRSKTDLLLTHKDVNLAEENLDFENSIHVDFKLNKHPVKSQKTYYFCQFFEVPQFETDVHLIRYQMMVDRVNKDIVHHLIVHECPISTANIVDEFGLIGHECGAAKAPDYVNQCIASSIIVAWVCIHIDVSYKFHLNLFFKLIILL